MWRLAEISSITFGVKAVRTNIKPLTFLVPSRSICLTTFPISLLLQHFVNVAVKRPPFTRQSSKQLR